jgi:hypothetical protein
MLVKEQELKVQLLEAQVANERAKAAENSADVALKEARTRNLHSKSDTTDLDYLEQESGVNRQHEEDMAKLAHGMNLDLKVLEGLAKQQKEAKPSVKV